jgi:6-phosphogluconate dehydrogenase
MAATQISLIRSAALNILNQKGLLFIGTGVSGGEEGARFGPSIMPGGSKAAWPHVKEIFQSIAAKVEDGTPCCDWVGENGAGHFVKMVHNGIEYGDMQLIAEAYHLMKDVLQLSHDEMSQVFAEWDQGKLDSYLIEITSEILGVKDEVDGAPLVEKILDSAGQKGTGRWTAIDALENGVPLTDHRSGAGSLALSAERRTGTRLQSAAVDRMVNLAVTGMLFLKDIHDALYASKMISYTQGYMHMQTAAGVYDWNLNYGGIALMWRGGCIIRSIFLGKIKEAYEANPALENLLLDPYFHAEIETRSHAWRRVIAQAVYPAFPPRPCRAPWPSMMVTAASGCPQTCCRPSAITLARTPTSASTANPVVSSTPIGWVWVVRQ